MAKRVNLYAQELMGIVDSIFDKHGLDVDTHAGEGQFYSDYAALEDKDPKAAKQAEEAFKAGMKMHSLAKYAHSYDPQSATTAPAPVPKLVTPASRTMTPDRKMHPFVSKAHSEMTDLIKKNAPQKEVRGLARNISYRADDMLDDVKMMFMKHNLDVDTHAGMSNFYGDHEKLEDKDPTLAKQAMDKFLDAEKLNQLVSYASMYSPRPE